MMKVQFYSINSGGGYYDVDDVDVEINHKSVKKKCEIVYDANYALVCEICLPQKLCLWIYFDKYQV